jgi:hypothetical protein
MLEFLYNARKGNLCLESREAIKEQTMDAKHRNLMMGLVLLALVAMACTCAIPGLTSGGAGGGLSYGQTVQGQINNIGDEESWTFNGTMGDIVTISMVGQGSFDDTYLELYGPGGNLLTQDDDSGSGLSALISYYTLPQTGTYRIVASAFGSDTGSYSLSLIRQ